MNVSQKEITMAGLLIAVFGFMMSAKHYTNIERKFAKTPVQGDKYKLLNPDKATRTRTYGAGLDPVFWEEHLLDEVAKFTVNDSDYRADHDYKAMPLL